MPAHPNSLPTQPTPGWLLQITHLIAQLLCWKLCRRLPFSKLSSLTWRPKARTPWPPVSPASSASTISGTLASVYSFLSLWWALFISLNLLLLLLPKLAESPTSSKHLVQITPGWCGALALGHSTPWLLMTWLSLYCTAMIFAMCLPLLLCEILDGLGLW